MTIQQKLILASFFIVSNLTAQEAKLENLLTNNASIGLGIGAISNASNTSDMGTSFSINYTKQINYHTALQGGFISGCLPDSKDENSFYGLTANSIINLPNLSVNSKLKLYLSLGAKLLNTKKEGKAIIPNYGGGLKYIIQDNIDLDLSGTVNPLSYPSDKIAAHITAGVSINYHFTKKEESVEWNNPLDAIYQDIADLKTKIDSVSANNNSTKELNPIQTEITNLKAEISNNKNNLKNIYTITKSNLYEIEHLNKEIVNLKATDNQSPLFIEPVIEEKIKKKSYHLIAGCFSSKQNADNLVQKLQSEGFKSSVIGQNEKGLFRVSFDSFSSRELALTQMQNIKTSGRSTWLLKQ